MNFKTLIIDPGTGQVSHTKIWSNIAYACATVAFMHLAMSENGASPDIWFIYLGVVGGATTLSKLISLKYGKAEP